MYIKMHITFTLHTLTHVLIYVLCSRVCVFMCDSFCACVRVSVCRLLEREGVAAAVAVVAIVAWPFDKLRRLRKQRWMQGWMG